MANIKIGISSGYIPQYLGKPPIKFGKPSRESTVSYLYAYKIGKSSSSNINFPVEKKDYSEITKDENFLFALNYTGDEDVGGFVVPPPDGIVSTGLKMTPQRSIYKREVWRDKNNQVYSEKILHPVVLQNNVSRVIDYNVATNRNYEYIIYLTDQSEGKTTQREIHFPITTKWDYWSISELHKTNEQNVYTTSENETWLFKFNVEPGEQQQNVAKSQQDTLGKYPAFSYGKKNYTTSSVSCLLGSEMLPFDFLTTNYVLVRNKDGSVSWGFTEEASEVYGGYTESRWKKLLDKCGMNEKVVNVFDTKITSNDSVDMLNEWKKLCNSGNPKLYKNSKGQSFIIQITEFSNSINESWDKQPITINFSWTEIADASDARIIQTTEFTTDTSGSVSGGGDEPVVDYNMLSNKPQINGVELVGNKTDKDLYLEAEGNIKSISGTSPSVTLDNNITYNLGSISGLTTTFGTINDKYYTERQCSQAEINFTAAQNFIYTPPEGTTIIGEDVESGKLSAKNGTSYNIGFGYVDGVMYAVCGIR